MGTPVRFSEKTSAAGSISTLKYWHETPAQALQANAAALAAQTLTGLPSGRVSLHAIITVLLFNGGIDFAGV